MIQDRIKELRRVQASELHPNPNNWRTHPKHQADALRGVLEEIGYADALLARELDDGSLELIDGHLRAETTPDDTVPVLILDVSEAEAGKLLATLDPLAAMATADAAKLEALLRDVQTGSEAVAGMLADLAEENNIIPNAPEPGDGGDEFDAGDIEQIESRVESGDVWIVGGTHRVMCGDSTSEEDVGKLLAGAKPFIMVTDPPYGVEYDADWRDEFNTWGKAATKSNVNNDEQIDWSGSYRLFEGDVAYVWHAGRHAKQVQQNLEDAGLSMRSQIIWNKPTMIMSRGHYHWKHEPCWYAHREGKTSRWSGDRCQTTVWEIQGMHAIGRSEERLPHPTQKPIECMARPIRNHGAEGDGVYDPFLGSGTTLIAAHRLNRICYGMEIDPTYCEVILRRAEAEGLTVEKA